MDCRVDMGGLEVIGFCMVDMERGVDGWGMDGMGKGWEEGGWGGVGAGWMGGGRWGDGRDVGRGWHT